MVVYHKGSGFVQKIFDRVFLKARLYYQGFSTV